MTTHLSWFFLCCVFISVSCAHQNIQRSESISDVKIINYAGDFLNTACQKPTGNDFATAWLTYEKKYWHFLSQTFYSGPSYVQERIKLARELGSRRDEMCKHTRAFLFVAPDIIQKSSRQVADLMGQIPSSKIYLVSALQWTDGGGRTFDGEDVYVLNARHDTYAKTTGLVSTIVHELVHSAQAVKFRDEEKALPPIVKNLYREGAAVFAVTLFFPELGYGATGIKQDQIEIAKKNLGLAARELLHIYEKLDPAPKTIKRFFEGGFISEDIPSKMGYLVSLEIYKQIALKTSPQLAVQISPSEFMAQSKSILTTMAGN